MCHNQETDVNAVFWSSADLSSFTCTHLCAFSFMYVYDVSDHYCCSHTEQSSRRVPWAVRRSNQSILSESNTEYSLERLILNVQYFGHLMWKANSLENMVMLGKIEGKRRRGQQRMRWLEGINDSMDMNLSKFWKMVRDREACYAAVPGVTKTQTNWMTEQWQQEKPGMPQFMGSQRVRPNLVTEQQQQQ